MGKDKRKLFFIQYLRAIAAVMVVFHHARNPQPWLFNPLKNYESLAWGVDIFFVISGFVMYIAAKNEIPSEFLKNRIIRIVPMYWFWTFALVAISTKFQPWSMQPYQITHLVKSLLFIPHYSPVFEGQIWPYLIPGWTLNYEMFFYAIFFTGLILNRVIVTTTSIILILIFSGFAIESKDALLKTYTDPIIFEFLGGILIAHFYEKKRIQKYASILAPIGFSVLLTLPFFSVKTC
ncbi:acyltransferase [Paraburkholderia sediminicola]|uniref:acyltransferase family protein n=1 Tax=Paraburkholderia sediminicola TaxID=458836 RepID=UPI0038BA7681